MRVLSSSSWSFSASRASLSSLPRFSSSRFLVLLSPSRFSHPRRRTHATTVGLVATSSSLDFPHRRVLSVIRRFSYGDVPRTARMLRWSEVLKAHSGSKQMHPTKPLVVRRFRSLLHCLLWHRLNHNQPAERSPLVKRHTWSKPGRCATWQSECSVTSRYRNTATEGSAVIGRNG